MGTVNENHNFDIRVERVKNLSRLCWKMQVLTRGFYCIVFFKSFLKRPVILDAVWGFPELHHLVKKEESIVELFYTTSRRGGGVVVHSKLLYREAPPRCLTPYPSIYHFDRKSAPSFCIL